MSGVNDANMAVLRAFGIPEETAQHARTATLSLVAGSLPVLTVETIYCPEDITPAVRTIESLRFRLMPMDESETPCTCTPGEGCDAEGDPGCGYCQRIDPEWPCPADESGLS